MVETYNLQMLEDPINWAETLEANEEHNRLLGNDCLDFEEMGQLQHVLQKPLQL